MKLPRWLCVCTVATALASTSCTNIKDLEWVPGDADAQALDSKVVSDAPASDRDSARADSSSTVSDTSSSTDSDDATDTVDCQVSGPERCDGKDNDCDGETDEIPFEAKSVAVAGGHSCALAMDGSLFCWGNNNSGALGLGDTDSRTTPRRVGGDKTYRSVAVGPEFTCAISEQRKVFCWGRDFHGEVGNGMPKSQVNSPKPVDFGMKSVQGDALATGTNAACLLSKSGELYCWGADLRDLGMYGKVKGELLKPKLYSDSNTYDSLAVGGTFACGVDGQGKTHCWGNNGSGQLGIDSSSSTPTTSPQTVKTSASFATVAAGGAHACALTEVGDMYCWGRNKSGQLGDGTNKSKNKPVRVQATGTYETIDVGVDHTCAIDDEGEAFCWGENMNGQLGIGQTGLPEKTPVSLGRNDRYEDIAAGRKHSCAVRKDGTVVCWGRGSEGQLGNDSVKDKLEPTPIACP